MWLLKPRNLPGGKLSDVRIKNAWQAGNREIEEDAIRFWDRLKTFPDDDTTEIRAKELCAVAYDGADLVAVSTSAAAPIKTLRANLALFRAAVDPTFRQQDLSRQLARESCLILEAWSIDNPDARLAGVVTIFESEYFYMRKRAPVTDLDFVLIDYTHSGLSILVKWFDHVVV